MGPSSVRAQTYFIYRIYDSWCIRSEEIGKYAMMWNLEWIFLQKYFSDRNLKKIVSFFITDYSNNFILPENIWIIIVVFADKRHYFQILGLVTTSPEVEHSYNRANGPVFGRRLQENEGVIMMLFFPEVKLPLTHSATWRSWVMEFPWSNTAISKQCWSDTAMSGQCFVLQRCLHYLC